MFNHKTQNIIDRKKPNTKKIKIANIAIFGSIQVLFNFIVILPIVVGELSNYLSQTVIFEPITLYTYTATLTLLQIGVQVYIGVINTKK